MMDKSKKVADDGDDDFYDEKEDDTINKSIKRQFLYQSANTFPSHLFSFFFLSSPFLVVNVLFN